VSAVAAAGHSAALAKPSRAIVNSRCRIVVATEERLVE
jgi:hypothetical protein